MRRFGTVLLVLILLILNCTAPVSAGDANAAAGAVQYSARFLDYTSLRDTGVRFGTSSWSGASMAVDGGELSVIASDGQKTYLLLPDPGVWTDTYVVEFTFRFTDIAFSNGYCGLLLSSQGDAPSNRTELIFRANGTVDGYGTEACEPLKKAAAESTPVTVRVLVNYGFLVSFAILVDGEQEGFYTPAALSRVAEGGRGFVLRNASAAFSSVRVVGGGYEDLANAPDAPSYMAPPEWQLPAPPSPPTGDSVLVPMLCLAAAAAAAGRLVRRRV